MARRLRQMLDVLGALALLWLLAVFVQVFVLVPLLIAVLRNG